MELDAGADMFHLRCVASSRAIAEKDASSDISLQFGLLDGFQLFNICTHFFLCILTEEIRRSQGINDKTAGKFSVTDYVCLKFWWAQKRG